MSIIEDADLKTLSSLGLTERQAKVYLALLRIGTSKAEAISEVSQIHRQEIYRVAIQLQELGLVEINVNKPTMFSAIPIDQALDILVQCKKKELRATLTKTKKLAKKFNRSDLSSVISEKPFFTIVSGSECHRRLYRALDGIKENVKIITCIKRFRQSFSVDEEVWTNALEAGVRLRIITEKSRNEPLPKWVTKALVNYSNFELKMVSAGVVSSSMVIHDNTNICMCIDPACHWSSSSQLWSNSKSLISLGQKYFDFMWAHSEKALF